MTTPKRTTTMRDGTPPLQLPDSNATFAWTLPKTRSCLSADICSVGLVCINGWKLVPPSNCAPFAKPVLVKIKWSLCTDAEEMENRKIRGRNRRRLDRKVSSVANIDSSELFTIDAVFRKVLYCMHFREVGHASSPLSSCICLV